jgi:hypothetical protein
MRLRQQLRGVWEVEVGVCGVQWMMGDTVSMYCFVILSFCHSSHQLIVADGNPRVIGIRDTESVMDLTAKMADARRIMVIGNGGIAMELVYEVKNCEVIWTIKDAAIGTTFFDEGAAKFFLSAFEDGPMSQEEEEKEGKDEKVLIKSKPMKRMRYMLDSTDNPSLHLQCQPERQTSSTDRGSALGPDWSSGIDIKASHIGKNVHIEYSCEVEKILSGKEFSAGNSKQTAVEGFDGEDRLWPLYVRLTTGSVFGCDLIVSATGVTPCLGFPVTTVKDGQEVNIFSDVREGMSVDEEMRTCVSDVYAAGDVCVVDWKDHSSLWFQMRLWSQARQMGAYAARCMTRHTLGEPVIMDFCFELFAHVTRFFGFKIVQCHMYRLCSLVSIMLKDWVRITSYC